MKSRVLVKIIKCLMSLTIIAGLMAGWWSAAKRIEEYALIDILANREVEAAMKIYAQFNATQTIAMKKDETIKKVIIPLYLPANAKSIDITLRQEREIISQWELANQTDLAKEGIAEVELSLPDNKWLAGEYALTFDGRTLDYAEQDQAPRVFIEKDNSRYAAGSYWVASNNKEGDISLKVVAQRMRWEGYWQEGKENLGRAVLSVLAYTLGAVILAAAPQALWRG